MTFAEQTNTHKCDLCGLLKTENNEACPQHRMWVAEAEVERLRMQLAACGVVALSNTRESAEKQREMLPEYRSGSLDDVETAVDELMDLRDEVERLRATIETQGREHAKPCGYGALCPWCEVERLQEEYSSLESERNQFLRERDEARNVARWQRQGKFYDGSKHPWLEDE